MCGLNVIPVAFLSLILTPCFSIVALLSCENDCREQIICSGFASSIFVSYLSKEMTSYILPLEIFFFIPVMCLKKDTINFIEERDLNQ